MSKVNILLVCGGGASSGFLAQSMKKAGRQKKLEVTVEAVGDSEIDNYIEDKQIVLFGPHLKYMKEDLMDVMADYPTIPHTFIPDHLYGALDGEGTLEFAFDFLQKEISDE